jgi:hypothetical protein
MKGTSFFHRFQKAFELEWPIDFKRQAWDFDKQLPIFSTKPYFGGYIPLHYIANIGLIVSPVQVPEVAIEDT